MRKSEAAEVFSLQDPLSRLDILGNAVSFHVRVLELLIARDLNERLRGLEIARGKGVITCLLLIDRHPGIRPSTLATAIMKDRAHVTRILDRFLESGLITRRTAANDSRATELCITPQGSALAARVRDVVTAHEEEFYRDILPPEDRGRFVEMLQRIYLSLSGTVKEGAN